MKANRFGWGGYVIRRRDERGAVRRIQAEAFINGEGGKKVGVQFDDWSWRHLTLRFGDDVLLKLAPCHAEMLGLALLTWGAATSDDLAFEHSKNRRKTKRHKTSR